MLAVHNAGGPLMTPNTLIIMNQISAYIGYKSVTRKRHVMLI